MPADTPPEPRSPSRDVPALDDDSLSRYHPSWYSNRTVSAEARETVDQQVAWLREIDSKAMRTLRFNTVILGLVIPTFSFAVRYDIVDSIGAFYTVEMAAGITFLLISTVLAGVTYTTSGVHTGVSADDIRTAHRRSLTDRSVHDTLVSSYTEWIESNHATIRRNAVLITATILCMIYALGLLALGTVEALVDVPAVVNWVVYATFAAVTVLANWL